jgi:hypothetical protein
VGVHRFRLPPATWTAIAGLVVCACSTWRVRDETPGHVIAQSQPERVRVTMLNGDEFVLLGPRLDGDSLSGVVMPDDAVGAGRLTTRRRIPVTVALADVRHVALEQTRENAWLPAALVVLAGVAVAVALGMSMGP